MTIYFTGLGGRTINRSKHTRGALIRNGSRVVRTIPETNDYEDCWFFGFNENEPMLTDDVFERIINFRGKLVLFRNDDGNDFPTDGIPKECLEKCAIFLRNQWYSDREQIQAEIRDRIGLLNPILKPMRGHSGKPLAERNSPLLFYSAVTGDKSLSIEENSRVKALRIMQANGINYVGGLIYREVNPTPPDDLLVKEIPQRKHDELMRDSRICLAIWGNNPLTYRFFEGFANRSLVLAQTLESIWFADCGMRAGEHYVELRADLSDLAEKIKYYEKNLDEAQRIADAGHRIFMEKFQFTGVNLPQQLFEQIVASWRPHVIAPMSNSLISKLKGTYLSLLKSV